MLRKTVILITLVLLLMQAVSASFDVKISDADSIYANETATYRVVVNNTGSSAETIKLNFKPDRRWSYETTPLTYLSPFTISPGEIVIFDLLIFPNSPLFSSGTYAITFPFVSQTTGNIEEIDVILHVRNPDALSDYVPALSFVLDALEDIDPRNTAKVKLEIRNRNPLNITEMVVDLSSTLYKNTQIVPIEPLGSTNVVFEIHYNQQQEPMNDLLIITVAVGDRVFAPIRKEVRIIAYKDVVEYNKATKSFFFKTETITEYTNKGNVNTTEEIKIPTNSFKQWFTTTEPAGEVMVIDGLLYYVTHLTIPIGETVALRYTLSYRPLVLLLLLLLISIGAYYYFRSPVMIMKETVTQYVDKDGRMKIKVLIHLKNRSMKLVENIDVRDTIPAVAEIEKHFEIGTVKPTKILKHAKAGTMLIWNIHHLEAYEERIITYRVQSTYAIVGNFTLPSTCVKFKGNKNICAVRSNKPRMRT